MYPGLRNTNVFLGQECEVLSHRVAVRVKWVYNPVKRMIRGGQGLEVMEGGAD